ncbi:hypothetical protein ACFL35_01755 [Candidatus Riflebacteria bacterium]
MGQSKKRKQVATEKEHDAMANSGVDFIVLQKKIRFVLFIIFGLFLVLSFFEYESHKYSGLSHGFLYKSGEVFLVFSSGILLLIYAFCEIKSGVSVPICSKNMNETIRPKWGHREDFIEYFWYFLAVVSHIFIAIFLLYASTTIIR